MLNFSQDQSSLVPGDLNAQLDYTGVNSQFKSVVNKAPHRIEAELCDLQTGAVFNTPSDELGNLTILIDVSSRVIQTHDPKIYNLSQRNDEGGSLHMATSGWTSLYFPADGDAASIGPLETYSIDRTMRTKISEVESRDVVTSKGGKERSRDSYGSVSEIESKRDALRQRNRIAANKCRQQKKARINEL